MSAMQIIFVVTGLITFISAVMVVAAPRLVHAGLWLILTLAGVAVTFVLLEATFLAVVQVLVYIGAIATLIIFAVMLTRRVMQETGPQENRVWYLALVLSLVLFAALLSMTALVPRFAAEAGTLTAEQETLLQELGRALVDVNAFVLPFEVASILLLAAMVGAIVIARPPGAAEEGEAAE